MTDQHEKLPMPKRNMWMPSSRPLTVRGPTSSHTMSNATGGVNSAATCKALNYRRVCPSIPRPCERPAANSAGSGGVDSRINQERQARLTDNGGPFFADCPKDKLSIHSLASSRFSRRPLNAAVIRKRGFGSRDWKD